MAQTNIIDRMRGCLVGGAAGDALGYPVEFLRLADIRKRYGEYGINEYTDGKGIVSDDTQMTMFTADGLLRDNTTLGRIKGVRDAYNDWYKTQTQGYAKPPKNSSWLLDLPELYVPRAPGITCMTSIADGCDGKLSRPVNDSKGCGGIMRVAPIGLILTQANTAAIEGSRCAALTHGHELGYMPAGMLAALISIIIDNPNWHMKRCILKAWAVCTDIFENFDYLEDMTRIVEKAINLAEHDKQLNDAKPCLSIFSLGEGWVAEETLAIALYCALRYENDFEAGIIAAVNHNGDSDSTGAVTGNILGAYLGEESIPEKFKTGLQFRKELHTLADRLFDERK